MATLRAQLADLPESGEALIFTLDSLQEKVLFVSHSLGGKGGRLSRIASGAVATRASTIPPEYMFDALVIVPLIIGAAGIGAFLFLGRTQRQLNEITTELAAITDGRSLHRRLALSEETTDFADLLTTLNAMISRLETSFAGLRRFTADASHELKTPLAVLRADVERAMTETASSTERMVALEEALQEVRRMADLVESLLTLARADEGRFDVHREPVELQPLVQEVYETAQILGEAQGVTVNLPFTADVVVMGDRTRLRQLFLNLVTNAIKYTPAGGKVELGLGRHPDNVTFAVRDTGIGISAADFPHIFERFWRADRVRSRMSERGGFGLGLAISQWIAQAHGGTLTASSRLGRGSLFTVTLPLGGDGQRS
jgi:signal transduction histidine kinase